MAKKSDSENLNFNLKLQQEINDLEAERSRNFSSYSASLEQEIKDKKEVLKINSELLEIDKKIAKLQHSSNDDDKKELDILTKQKKVYQEKVKLINESYAGVGKINTLLKAGANELTKWADNKIGFGAIWKFLNDSDGALKAVNKELGNSGNRSAIFRDNVTIAAKNVAGMGVSLTDIVKLQSSFSEETGKASILSSQALTNMSKLSTVAGTSVEQVGLLAGTMDKVGVSATRSVEIQKDLIDDAVKLGLNAGKIIKEFGKNYKTFQNLNFNGGIEGMRKMSVYASQMNVDISSSLGSVDKFRTLEGAIESAAKLQTLGGEFAKNNPFELGFLARNKPEEFIKKLNEMSTGMAQLNKVTGEVTISAVNLDILREVANATGQDFDKLVSSTKTLGKTQIIGKDLFSMTPEEKSLITNMASFNNKTGTFQIQIGDKGVDINKLTQNQLSLFKEEKKSLEDMNKANQTFDEVFKNVIMELKVTMLPLLQQLNTVTKFLADNSKVIGIAVAGIVGIVTGGKLLALINNAKYLVGGSTMTGMLGRGAQLGGSTVGNTVGTPPISNNTAPDISKMGNPASNYKLAASIAAIGVAALGVGAGIYLATKGFSELANSISKLPEKQLQAFMSIMKGAAIVIPATILAIGAAGMASATGLLAFGGAALMVGGAIAIGAAGIGYMANNLSKLNDPNIGINLMSIGKGLGIMSASFLNPLFPIGMASFALGMNSLRGLDLSSVASSFDGINTFLKSDLSNLQVLKDTLESLKSFDISGINKITEALSNIDLKVRMDGIIPINVNTTLKMDGYVVANAVNRYNQKVVIGGNKR